MGGIIKKKHRMKANYLLFGREREKAYRSKDLSPQENSITSSWGGRGGLASSGITAHSLSLSLPYVHNLSYGPFIGLHPSSHVVELGSVLLLFL